METALPGPSEHRAAVGAIIVALSLFAIKAIAWWVTGSAALYSDAMESVVNVLAAGVAVWSIRMSMRPPDRSHPYGHGKAEFVSATFEGGMILVAAVVIMFRAVENIVTPELRPQTIPIGIAAASLTVVINGAYGAMLIRHGRRRNSIVLVASGRHLLTDALSTIGLIAGLATVGMTGWLLLDPAIALVAALFITITGWRLLRGSLGGLMDEQDSADHRTITAALEAHCGPAATRPEICSYHKVRHRHAGRLHWVEFHLRVPASLDVRAGHEIATQIEHEIEAALRPATATAHVEPCEAATCPRCGRAVGASDRG